MQLRHLTWALPLVLAMASLGDRAQAQCTNLLKVKWEAWVDPVVGVDGTQLPDPVGTVGGPAQVNPYRTINYAIGMVASVRTLGMDEGIVHALPGLYSAGSNGEIFPINMNRGVHVQGAGAKETVLRVRPTDPLRWRHIPLRNSTLAQRTQLRHVAVDFGTAAFPPAIYQVLDEESGPMLDGFTIQGADIQVSVESEMGIIRGRVSNCLFDMRDGGAEMLVGPDFGILICAIYDPNHTYVDKVDEETVLNEHEKHYATHHMHVFNNTFVQGCLSDGSMSDPVVDLAKGDSVGICDFAETLDQDGALRGVNRHNIQNNLFRTLDQFQLAATLGIDQGDASVLIASTGVLPRPTNAFDTGMARQQSVPNQVFESLVVNTGTALPALLPTPIVDLAPADPGFIGEYLALNRAAAIRDFRLLPDSVLVDAGASPLFAGACGTIGALNLLNYSELIGSLKESFDFDGEVHGNPRIRGADVDIGMDETDVLEIAGSYGNDTKSHLAPWNPNLGNEIPGVPIVPAGLADRSYIVPTAGTLFHIINFDFTLQNVVTGVTPFPLAWTNMLGSAPVPDTTTAPPLTIWLDIVNYTPATVTTTAAAATWLNWQSAQLHSFGEFVWVNAADDGSPPSNPPIFTSYFDSQVFFLNAAGLVSSNLQSEYF